MREIKIENNAVCHGCLSSNRKTLALGVLADLLKNLIGDKNKTMFCAVEDVKFCWECMAVLKKFKSFQNQWRNAQTVLMQMLCDQDFSPVTLSKLGTIEKHYYDQDYTYLHIEDTKDDEHANIIDSKETIKEEGYSEFDYTDNNSDPNETTNDKTEFYYDVNVIRDIDQDNILQNVNNDSDMQIKVKSEEDSGKQRKLDESSDEDFDYCPNDNDEVTTELGPKKVKKRKRGRPELSGINFYKQYLTLLEREKIDWGKVDDYFTMITFGEAEMEEHFLLRDIVRRSSQMVKYKCVPCNRGYLRCLDMLRHNDLNHNKNADWKCSACHRKLFSLEELEKHWHEHTPVAKCNLCGDVCRPLGKKKHLNYAHTKKYACQFCKMTYGKIFEFIKHFKETHQKFICDYCNKSCKTKNLVEQHISKHHNTFTCDICNKQFNNYRRYKHHNHLFHPDPTKERPELAYCVECNKQFSSVIKYKEHLKTSPRHTEIKRVMLPCPDCGKIFKKKNYLNNHYNLFHAKKSKHYCELCDKYYVNGYALRTHRSNVHMKVIKSKDKMCDLCGRGFSTNRTLVNHRRTHTGERPFQCPFCSAAFAQKYAMQSHCRTQHRDVKSTDPH